jgi:hypothetical protein
MSEEGNQEEVTQVADGEPDAAQASDEAQVEEVKESAPLENGEQAQPEDAPAKPKGAQKRIGELTHNWRSAERERDYWRDVATQSKQQPNNQPVEQPKESVPPTLEGVGYDEGRYQQAMAEWVQGNIDKQVDQRLSAREQEAEKSKTQEQLAHQRAAFDAKSSDFAETKDDFYDVAYRNDLSVTDSMAEALMAVEKGPEVLYHLGQNPGEADRISRLPPQMQALEIGRLEAKVSLPKAKTVSQAPPPIEPINGGGEPPAASPDKMTPEQWREMRNKQLLDKRGYT